MSQETFLLYSQGVGSIIKDVGIEPALWFMLTGSNRKCYQTYSTIEYFRIGGPKWARISYPVARYIHSVKGLKGKRVASVSTFGGPPLNVFELELIEMSMERSLTEAGASVISHLFP